MIISTNRIQQRSLHFSKIPNKTPDFLPHLFIYLQFHENFPRFFFPPTTPQQPRREFYMPESLSLVAFHFHIVISRHVFHYTTSSRDETKIERRASLFFTFFFLSLLAIILFSMSGFFEIFFFEVFLL